MVVSFAGDVTNFAQMSCGVCAIIIAPVVRCTIPGTVERNRSWTYVARYSSAVDRQRRHGDGGKQIGPDVAGGKDALVTATADIALA
jgi:hypothetical protein